MAQYRETEIADVEGRKRCASWMIGAMSWLAGRLEHTFLTEQKDERYYCSRE